ncbi:hypothetical protein [Actinoplanes sp. M2I2]|uniref:hypothetical protein n=1 Tax=Actinoplanes sp. M2I2 TaxID=1734444 RepID=UPI002021304A|nr:hypothetical protein [Actinoplanes sp. M2I2]
MEHDHPLSEAMAEHDHTDHDLLVVHANVEALAKRYRQRRLLRQSTAGVVISASLFVGAAHIYGQTEQPVLAAGAQATPSEQLSSAERTAITRFLAAGYDYDDAAKLALLWKTPDITAAKIAAGEQLLDKRPLPFPPTSQAHDGQTQESAIMVDAFFAEGYDFRDAQRLAALWKTPSPYEAKVEAGKKLLRGEELPIKP